MGTLDKRLSKLESGATRESTVVIIHSWLGEGEYFGLTHGDVLIRRRLDETEDAFLARAEREILDQVGSPPLITCFAIRQSEMTTA